MLKVRSFQILKIFLRENSSQKKKNSILLKRPSLKFFFPPKISLLGGAPSQGGAFGGAPGGAPRGAGQQGYNDPNSGGYGSGPAVGSGTTPRSGCCSFILFGAPFFLSSLFFFKQISLFFLSSTAKVIHFLGEFLCFNCKTPISGEYLTKDGHQYCRSCAGQSHQIGGLQVFKFVLLFFSPFSFC